MSRESQIKAANNSMHEALAHLKMARELMFEREYDSDGDCYITIVNPRLEKKLRSMIDTLEAIS